MKKKLFFLFVVVAVVASCVIRKENSEDTTKLLGNDSYWQKKFPNGIPNDYLNEEYYIKKSGLDVLKKLTLVNQKVAGERRPTLIYTFDKKLDFNSITTSAISITKAGSSTLIAFSILVDENQPYSFKLACQETLEEKCEYIVEMDPILDIAGIQAAVKINFFTTPFSFVYATYPIDHGDIYSNEFFSIKFVDDIEFELSSISESSILIKKSDNSQVPFKSFNYDDATKTVLLSATLEDNESYTLEVTNEIKYKDGDEFVPMPKERVVFFTHKVKNDFVKNFSPENGSSGKANDFTTFTITLNDGVSLDPSTVIPFNIYFQSKKILSKTFNVEDIVYNSADNFLVITAATLPFDEYNLVFNGVEFINGVKTPNLNYCFTVTKFGRIGANFDTFTKEKIFGESSDPDYVVVMRDDFDKGYNRAIQKNDGSWYYSNNSPNPQIWDHIGEFAGNNSCRPENAYIQDGKLVIKAERQDYTFYGQPFAMKQSGFNDMAGRVQTKEKFGFLYGRVRAKFKLAGGRTWPAIWMLANNEQSANEIDFIEYYPYSSSRRWDVVLHKNFNQGNVGYNGGKSVGPGESLSNYDIIGTLDWLEKSPNSGTSTVKITADFYKGQTKMGTDTVCDLDGRNYYQAPMYPIIEIQQSARCWVNGGGAFNSIETLEVDWIEVLQSKQYRYATFVDPLYNLDNFIASSGIKNASYDEVRMEIDGIDVGEFFYKGQPRYENSLLKVSSDKNEQEYIIYKAKNIKGVYLCAYYPNDLVNRNRVGNLATGTTISASNAFTIECSDTLDSTFTPIALELEDQCNGAATWYKDSWEHSESKDYNEFVQVYFYKTNLPQRSYNYVKINFPTNSKDSNLKSIYLGVVVLTRYEGTDFNDYTMEGEL